MWTENTQIINTSAYRSTENTRNHRIFISLRWWQCQDRIHKTQKNSKSDFFSFHIQFRLNRAAAETVMTLLVCLPPCRVGEHYNQPRLPLCQTTFSTSANVTGHHASRCGNSARGLSPCFSHRYMHSHGYCSSNQRQMGSDDKKLNGHWWKMQTFYHFMRRTKQIR